MQIACPACSATYNVPDSMIGAGRNMRCVRCMHEWYAAPPAAAAAEPQPAISALEPPDALPIVKIDATSAPKSRPETSAPAATVAPARSPIMLSVAWAGSIAVMAGGGYSVWLWRDRLTEFWPPMARLYGLLAS